MTRFIHLQLVALMVTNAADRSGLRLSARLLGLAKIVKDEPAHP